jgi:hypothetical protein
MNEQTAEYRIIHKTDLGRLQMAVDEYAAKGFTLMGPVQFAMDNELMHPHQYLATMERKVEAREQEEV